MPALRNRGDDVVLIANYFRERFAAQYGRPASPLDPGMIARLRAYDWPGNVRELENLALRQILLDDRDGIEIGTSMAGSVKPQHYAGDDPTLGFRSAKAIAVAQFEKSYLRQLLAKTRGNVSEAAKICGKDRSTLNKLVKKHGLTGSIRDRPSRLLNNPSRQRGARTLDSAASWQAHLFLRPPRRTRTPPRSRHRPQRSSQDDRCACRHCPGVRPRRQAFPPRGRARASVSLWR
jgi:Bacterial regulatory protein, Fis family